MQLTKKFSADELCKEIFFAVAFEKYSFANVLNENIIVFGFVMTIDQSERWKWRSIYIERQLRINHIFNGISVVEIRFNWNSQIRETGIIAQRFITLVLLRNIFRDLQRLRYLIFEIKCVFYRSKYHRQNYFCENVSAFKRNRERERATRFNFLRSNCNLWNYFCRNMFFFLLILVLGLLDINYFAILSNAFKEYIERARRI